jgi:dipeptidyl aminopeptidase/acylaminoacyl peptidase
VDAKAFRGAGSLAFVFKGALYVLDGATGALRRISVPGRSAAAPRFSADGKWLAFAETLAPFSCIGCGLQNARLSIANADGTDPHEVKGLEDPQLVGWSPTSDELAVITSTKDPLNPTVAFENAVRIVSPEGGSRLLYSVTPTAKAPTILYDAVWSPNGRDIALATTNFFSGGRSVLLSLNVVTGKRTNWLSLPIRRSFHGYTDTIIDPSGWWKKWGIGFWVFQGGMVHDNDGSPLYVLASPGFQPKELGTTLSDGVTDAVAASPTGQLAIVSAGIRDVASSGTKVETCSLATRSCTPVPGATTWNAKASFSCPPGFICVKPATPGNPGSGVTVDPSWSPDGSELAYARGPAAPLSVTSTSQWLAYHELYIYDAKTKTSRPVASLRGVSVPQWSSNGRYLLYTARDSIWLLRVRSSRPVRIAGPLFIGHVTETYQDIYPNYYHQVPWSEEFSWWST